jgi:hypothetical protein
VCFVDKIDVDSAASARLKNQPDPWQWSEAYCNVLSKHNRDTCRVEPLD